MKYAVFSDVHGNIGNLGKFFSECDKWAIDNYIFLGDIVHKGERYVENVCIDLIRERECIAIKGNHDVDLIKNSVIITQKNKEYISKLPKQISLGELLLFHDSLIGIKNQVWNPERIGEEFKYLNEQGISYGLCGHVHKPFIFSQSKDSGTISKVNEKTVSFHHNYNYILNPGAISEGYYGVIDLESKEFVFLELSD